MSVHVRDGVPECHPLVFPSFAVSEGFGWPG